MENNLESYLDVLEAQLSDLPDARRAGFVNEARAHLWAMVEAKRADGLGEAQACADAMAEFGEAAQVGRDLREQWANSRQLESEGAPLSLRRKLRMFALPVVGCILAFTLFTWIQAPQNGPDWKWLVIAIFVFGCLAFGISSEVRARGGWKPSTIVACVSAFVISSNSLLHLSGHKIGSGAWRDWAMPIFVLAYTSLYFWLRKREKSRRPWQFSARYKTSPVAAEQEYRLAPLVGLAMGTTMGCIGIVSVGLQFFGWPLALLSCAGLIGAAAVFSRWLLK